MHENGTFKERLLISLEGICFLDLSRPRCDSSSSVTYLHLFKKKVLNGTFGHCLVFNGTHEILYLSLLYNYGRGGKFFTVGLPRGVH